jgi:hypothetical protein
MISLKAKLLALAMIFVVSAGAFAQKDKRPEKPKDTKVVVKDKEPRDKPPQNDNRDKRGDKKGKP